MGNIQTATMHPCGCSLPTEIDYFTICTRAYNDLKDIQFDAHEITKLYNFPASIQRANDSFISLCFAGKGLAPAFIHLVQSDIQKHVTPRVGSYLKFAYVTLCNRSLDGGKTMTPIWQVYFAPITQGSGELGQKSTKPLLSVKPVAPTTTSQATGTDTRAKIQDGSDTLEDNATKIPTAAGHVVPKSDILRTLWRRDLYELAHTPMEAMDSPQPIALDTLAHSVVLRRALNDITNMPHAMQKWAACHSATNAKRRIALKFITAATIINELVIGIAAEYKTTYIIQELQLIKWTAINPQEVTAVVELALSDVDWAGTAGTTSNTGNYNVNRYNLVKYAATDGTDKDPINIPTLVVMTRTTIQNSYDNKSLSINIAITENFVKGGDFIVDAKMLKSYVNAPKALAIGNGSTVLSEFLNVRKGLPLNITCDGGEVLALADFGTEIPRSLTARDTRYYPQCDLITTLMADKNNAIYITGCVSVPHFADAVMLPIWQKKTGALNRKTVEYVWNQKGNKSKVLQISEDLTLWDTSEISPEDSSAASYIKSLPTFTDAPVVNLRALPHHAPRSLYLLSVTDRPFRLGTQTDVDNPNSARIPLDLLQIDWTSEKNDVEGACVNILQKILPDDYTISVLPTKTAQISRLFYRSNFNVGSDSNAPVSISVDNKGIDGFYLNSYEQPLWAFMCEGASTFEGQNNRFIALLVDNKPGCIFNSDDIDDQTKIVIDPYSVEGHLDFYLSNPAQLYGLLSNVSITGRLDLQFDPLATSGPIASMQRKANHSLDVNYVRLGFPLTLPKVVPPTIAATHAPVEFDDSLFRGAFLRKVEALGITLAENDIILFELRTKVVGDVALYVIYNPEYQAFYIWSSPSSDSDYYKTMRKLTFEDLLISNIRVANKMVTAVFPTDTTNWINRVSTNKFFDGKVVGVSARLPIRGYHRLLPTTTSQAELLPMLAMAGGQSVASIFQAIGQYFAAKGMMNTQLQNKLKELQQQFENSSKLSAQNFEQAKQMKQLEQSLQLDRMGLAQSAYRSVIAPPDQEPNSGGVIFDNNGVKQSFVSGGIQYPNSNLSSPSIGNLTTNTLLGQPSQFDLLSEIQSQLEKDHPEAASSLAQISKNPTKTNVPSKNNLDAIMPLSSPSIASQDQAGVSSLSGNNTLPQNLPAQQLKDMIPEANKIQVEALVHEPPPGIEIQRSMPQQRIVNAL